MVAKLTNYSHSSKNNKKNYFVRGAEMRFFHILFDNYLVISKIYVNFAAEISFNKKRIWLNIT